MLFIFSALKGESVIKGQKGDMKVGNYDLPILKKKQMVDQIIPMREPETIKIKWYRGLIWTLQTMQNILSRQTGQF